MTATGNLVMVSTTVASEADAAALADRLVSERLVACVQYYPIRSVYRWKGKVEQAAEHLVIAKSRTSLADAVVAFIKSVHGYELPEVIVTPIAGGYAPYLEWVLDETRARE